MRLIDVNVLVYAFREAAPDHKLYLRWLEECVNSDQSFGLTELVLSGFLRIATHPKVFNPPSPLEPALAFIDTIKRRTNCVIVAPGARHWEIFVKLCRAANAKGNLVSDAYLAAIAIESGSEWITADRDYSRFPGLRWLHPLDARHP